MNWRRHLKFLALEKETAPPQENDSVAENETALSEQDVCYLGMPSEQALVDLIPDWTSTIPLPVKSGYADLFHDNRTEWAIKVLGGLTGKSVLELGPFEAAHTYMFENAGASEVLAIEANKMCVMKCMIVKELLNLTRSRFLHGNFTEWFDQSSQHFDFISAAGVLYHMDDPCRLLKQISDHTDRVFIWTHFAPEGEPNKDEAWAKTLIRVEDRNVGGRKIPHFIKSYLDLGDQTIYSGGVYHTASWIRKADILGELERLGFKSIETTGEVLDHPNGPCISIAASKN